LFTLISHPHDGLSRLNAEERQTAVFYASTAAGVLVVGEALTVVLDRTPMRGFPTPFLTLMASYETITTSSSNAYFSLSLLRLCLSEGGEFLLSP